MIIKHSLTLAAISLLLTCATIASTSPYSPGTNQNSYQRPSAFTKNVGQWDERVLFRAEADGATLWFTKDGVTYQFVRSVRDKNLSDLSAPPDLSNLSDDRLEQLVLTARFSGANPDPEIIAEGQMEYKCNYFLGSDPAGWHADVPNYESITYRDVYDGVDLQFFGDTEGQVSYRYQIATEENASRVNIVYEGVDDMSRNASGVMIARTAWGELNGILASPSTEANVASPGFSTQSPGGAADGSQTAATTSSQRAAITLIYSTYLGGTSQDEPRDVEVDGEGCAYLIGDTSSPSFPFKSGYDSTWAGARDVFITKFSSSGNSLIYSTYLGGSGTEWGYGIEVDGSGRALVAGHTSSTSFPTVSAYDSTYNGGDFDVFVAKLSANGNSLIYSTFLGGSDDDMGAALAIDVGGYAYVTGYTYSTDIPMVNAYDNSHSGLYDTYVIKLAPAGNSLSYSTYLGGSNNEWGLSIQVDSYGYAYIAGICNGTGYPTVNAYDASFNGGNWDAVLTKLSNSGTALSFSTYFGGAGEEFARSVVVDGSGRAVICGFTESSDLPTANAYDASYNGGGDAFLAKFSATGNTLIFSTFLGGVYWDYGYGLALDASGGVYSSGMTSGPFPTVNAYDSTHNGEYDAYAAKFSASGSTLDYSTYLGGSNLDFSLAMTLDTAGCAYVTGWTMSTDFPTYNAFDSTYNGNNDDCFLTKLTRYLPDADNDGIADQSDNCPAIYNPTQVNTDGDALGDTCDTCPQDAANDSDADGICGNIDNCPAVSNANQINTDGDALGDACDACPLDAANDFDQDGICGDVDNCPTTDNPSQADTDGDAVGDACDNCLLVSNTNQLDADHDNIGDACDYVCGDANNDSAIDISDAVYLIAYIFSGGAAPNPEEAGDVNCDNAVDISDAVYLIAHIFSGGPAPCAGCE